MTLLCDVRIIRQYVKVGFSFGFIFLSDPCASVTCSGQGEICRVNDLGQAVCGCNGDCPQVYQPVCGSDGKHYDNRCKLDYKACRKNRPIFEAECQGLSRGRGEIQYADMAKQKACIELHDPCIEAAYQGLWRGWGGGWV